MTRATAKFWILDWDDRDFRTTLPPYAETYSDGRWTVVLQGILRHDGTLLSARDVPSVDGPTIQLDKVTGNGTITVIDRAERKLSAYRTVLGTPEIYYWTDKGRLLCADNLGAMAALLPEPGVCERALPLHFIYRSVPGELTYLQNVHRLGPGQLLEWADGHLEVQLRRDIRTLVPQCRVEVDADSISTFFDTLSNTISKYEEAARKRGSGTAVMLSGGVDSSLMVLAAGRSGRKPVALTMITKRAVELERETAYARQAAKFLQAEHRLIETAPMNDAETLIETIKTLGQPPNHETTAGWLIGSLELARQEPGLGLLLGGNGADALHGAHGVLDIRDAERCPAWSLPALRLAAKILRPVLPATASRARALAAMLQALRLPESPLHPTNNHGAYTDWAVMAEAFGRKTLEEAMKYRRVWAARYADPETVTEQMQVIALFSAWDTACLFRQIGLSAGREIAFPFLDESLISASLAFNLNERFVAGGRTKPVLKAALARGTSDEFVNRPKLSGGFPVSLFREMRSGSLADLVRSIKRPSFLSRKLFEQKLNQPDWFTWNLLTFDLWEKLVLHQRQGPYAQRGHKPNQAIA